MYNLFYYPFISLAPGMASYTLNTLEYYKIGNKCLVSQIEPTLK